MAKSYASTVIPAPVEQVWSVVRDFDGLPQWHPAIASSSLLDGARPAEVGAVRELSLADGGQVREKLVALDDVERSLSYEMLGGPFPIRSYLATVRVHPVSGDQQCFAEWYAHYDADAADEAELDKTFGQGVFATGLQGLSRKFTS